MINALIERQQTKIFNKYGVFFAFNKKQFNEGHNPNLGKVLDAGGGMFVPSIFEDKVYNKLKNLHEKATKHITDTKTKKEIIWYELGNHEAQITGDITDTLNALSNFKHISREDVEKEYQSYFDHCVEHDYF